jgi:hypothetical protein
VSERGRLAAISLTCVLHVKEANLATQTGGSAIQSGFYGQIYAKRRARRRQTEEKRGRTIAKNNAPGEGRTRD